VTTSSAAPVLSVGSRDGRPAFVTDTVQDVSVLGRRIRVSVRPGVGPPLVLCNGIGAGLELLQPFVDALDPDLPVVRFDVPGVGGSALPWTPYRFSIMAWMLGTVLDRLGYDEVDVLGISWGGGLAQQFALQNPRRCRRLVLVSTGTGALMIPAHPRILAKMITPRRYRDPDCAISIAALVYGGRLRERPELASQLLDAHSPLASRRGYVLQLLAAAGWTSLPVLPLIRQQTLILAGDDDPIIPMANARLMRRLLPHATVHVYHDGHLGLVTSAGDLAPVLEEFLRPAAVADPE
jgi:poly(3-hydroxyalkanoate) depolymerase